jgi:hypothetical protein
MFLKRSNLEWKRNELSVCNFGLFFDCRDFHPHFNVYCNRVRLYSELFFLSASFFIFGWLNCTALGKCEETPPRDGR